MAPDPRPQPSAKVIRYSITLGVGLGLLLSFMYVAFILCLLLLTSASAQMDLSLLAGVLTVLAVASAIGILPAALAGALTGIIVGISAILPQRLGLRKHPALVGLLTCLVLATGLHIAYAPGLLAESPGSYGLRLGVPSLIYIIAGTLATPKVYRFADSPPIQPITPSPHAAA